MTINILSACCTVPAAYQFFELFNTEADPWQMTNLYANATAEAKATLHALVADNFRCTRAECLQPVDMVSMQGQQLWTSDYQ